MWKRWLATVLLVFLVPVLALGGTHSKHGKRKSSHAAMTTKHKKKLAAKSKKSGRKLASTHKKKSAPKRHPASKRSKKAKHRHYS